MQKLFLCFFLLSTLLFAKNPIAYAALGDVLYNNADKIAKLKEIEEYKSYTAGINKYLQDLKETKIEGFAVKPNSSEVVKKAYLNKLRSLVKMNDFFVHSVYEFYNVAKEEQNSRLFSQIINTGLLNTDEHKQEILDYYFSHVKDMNTTGIIQSYLDEDAKILKKKKLQQKRYKSKKELEAQRIKEIRQRDKRDEERLEKKLQQELEYKKEQIRKYQQKELKKTI
ncbi:hypothetical protein MNB_SM-6-1266 [hydrothermal vent metagenome]|uniref:Uncharacterized protein n=1 Tax=hydrothermal vent metagenome TaxID=652676 RepID=A0A1W1BJA2_9ZZZZ